MQFEKNKNIILEKLLKKTEEKEEFKIINHIPENKISKHYQILEILKKVKNAEEIQEEEKEFIENFFKTKIDKIKDELINNTKEKIVDESKNISQSKISIKLSSYVVCKGLSAGFVFILGLNKGNFT